MLKRKITLDCTDIDETVGAFKWVYEKHMRQLEYRQALGMDMQTTKQVGHCVLIRLRPDRVHQKEEFDADGYRYWVPSAWIKFEVPPLSKWQEVTLDVTLESSKPKTASWKLVEEIFDSFTDYLRAKGYKVQEMQELMPNEDSGAVAEQPTLTEDEGGKKPEQIDTKLDALLAGQTAIREDLSGLRQAVLARFDTSEQTVIATVVQRLDQGQLATVQAVLDAIEAELVPIDELEETLVAVQHTLSEIQQQGAALPDSTLVSEVERLSEVADAPKLDAKHKLKVTVPIIPYLLSYEGEVELKSGLNLEATWNRLVAKVRGT
jgi:hypothetical protein